MPIGAARAGLLGALVAIIDNFEDGDLSEYTLNQDTNTNGTITTVTSPVYQGQRALQIVNDNDGDVSADRNQSAVSTSGLDYYPQQDDTWTVRIRGNDWTNVNADHQWAVQDTAPVLANYIPPCYRLAILGQPDTFRIQRIDSDGTVTTLAEDTSVTWSNYNDDYLECTTTWLADGTIDVEIRDSSGTAITSGSATDTTYTSGGIGFGHEPANASPTDVYWDYAHRR